jgi:hypothetical protein
VFEEFLLDEHIRIPALAGVRRRYLWFIIDVVGNTAYVYAIKSQADIVNRLCMIINY